jgi:hypothetical protein
MTEISEDFEMLEINAPANFEPVSLDGPPALAKGECP